MCEEEEKVWPKSHKTGLAEQTGCAGKQIKISLVRCSLGRPKCTLEMRKQSLEMQSVCDENLQALE